MNYFRGASPTQIPSSIVRARPLSCTVPPTGHPPSQPPSSVSGPCADPSASPALLCSLRCPIDTPALRPALRRPSWPASSSSPCPPICIPIKLLPRVITRISSRPSGVASLAASGSALALFPIAPIQLRPPPAPQASASCPTKQTQRPQRCFHFLPLPSPLPAPAPSSSLPSRPSSSPPSLSDIAPPSLRPSSACVLSAYPSSRPPSPSSLSRHTSPISSLFSFRCLLPRIRHSGSRSPVESAAPRSPSAGRCAARLTIWMRRSALSALGPCPPALTARPCSPRACVYPNCICSLRPYTPRRRIAVLYYAYRSPARTSSDPVPAIPSAPSEPPASYVPGRDRPSPRSPFPLPLPLAGGERTHGRTRTRALPAKLAERALLPLLSPARSHRHGPLPGRRHPHRQGACPRARPPASLDATSHPFPHPAPPAYGNANLVRPAGAPPPLPLLSPSLPRVFPSVTVHLERRGEGREGSSAHDIPQWSLTLRARRFATEARADIPGKCVYRVSDKQTSNGAPPLAASRNPEDFPAPGCATGPA
ncbi:hypothetical protein C8Q77DRAFT_90630 [Trametes polyzona]|nr:hypothetical protein C8Q77DRAFT_90630 [Trametes polyzona]